MNVVMAVKASAAEWDMHALSAISSALKYKNNQRRTSQQRGAGFGHLRHTEPVPGDRGRGGEGGGACPREQYKGDRKLHSCVA